VQQFLANKARTDKADTGTDTNSPQQQTEVTPVPRDIIIEKLNLTQSLQEKTIRELEQLKTLIIEQQQQQQEQPQQQQEQEQQQPQPQQQLRAAGFDNTDIDTEIIFNDTDDADDLYGGGKSGSGTTRKRRLRLKKVVMLLVIRAVKRVLDLVRVSS
jgi:hypothetical protein